MRIVTRPDFDGIVCAVLLLEAESISKKTLWVEPNQMQKGQVDIEADDIVANLPYHENCAMWFDHHYSNEAIKEFKGVYKIAPSAAGLIYDYYDRKFAYNYDELVIETDKIDSANLSIDEVNFPEKYPYVLLSMTISGREKNDEPYWNRVIELLRKMSVEKVMEDTYVRHRCNVVIENNILYKELLHKHTQIDGQVAITDFRSYRRAPAGNRFLIYSLYPDSNVQIKIFNDRDDLNKTIISVGHSIFNRTCKVNVGHMLKNFEGGGHHGAGSCSFDKEKFNDYYSQILSILRENVKNDE